MKTFNVKKDVADGFQSYLMRNIVAAGNLKVRFLRHYTHVSYWNQNGTLGKLSCSSLLLRKVQTTTRTFYIFLNLACVVQGESASNAHRLDVSMSNTNGDILTIGRSTECRLECANWEQVYITVGSISVFLSSCYSDSDDTYNISIGNNQKRNGLTWHVVKSFILVSMLWMHSPADGEYFLNWESPFVSTMLSTPRF